jgi:hypothetical protein
LALLASKQEILIWNFEYKPRSSFSSWFHH